MKTAILLVLLSSVAVAEPERGPARGTYELWKLKDAAGTGPRCLLDSDALATRWRDVKVELVGSTVRVNGDDWKLLGENARIASAERKEPWNSLRVVVWFSRVGGTSSIGGLQFSKMSDGAPLCSDYLTFKTGTYAPRL